VDAILIAEGRVDAENGDPKILVDKLTQENLETAAAESTSYDYGSYDNGSNEPLNFEPTIPDMLAETSDSYHSSPQPADDWEDERDVPAPPEPDDWHLYPPPAPGEEKWQSAPQSPDKMVESPTIAEDLQKPAPVEPEPSQPENPPKAGIQPATAPAQSPVKQHSNPIQYIMPPAERTDDTASEPGELRMITIVLRDGGDRQRDVRRMRRVYGMLNSYPGRDKFALRIFENGKHFLLEFPNDTTGINSDLLRDLKALVGEDNVRVEKIKLQ
jgi:DNA polymerase-3 subunit alpha